ncbi:MAG: hypothetical protein AAF741_12835 [Bacteroidota bacterium]
MKVYFRWLFVFFALPQVVFFSCNPEEQEPAYVTFEGFNFAADPSEGSSSSDIENVWVFADEVFLGVYDLPARIPMLLSGPTALRFEAGVKENGLSSLPNIYPFYEAVNRDVELIPGETIAIGRQNIGYRNDVVFGFIEGFEPNEARVYNSVLIGGDPIDTTTESIFEGQASGVIRLSDTNAVVEILADPVFEEIFTQAETPRLWLEMDFRSEALALVGISGTNRDGFEFRAFDPGFVAREEWTKIYFNLSVLYANNRTEIFQTGIASILPEGLTEADIFLDNIKLLYR